MSTIPKGYSAFLVMLLLVCAVLFASCGGGNGTSASTPTPTPSPTPTPTPTPMPCPPPTADLVIMDSLILVKLPDGNYSLHITVMNRGADDVQYVEGAVTDPQAIMTNGPIVLFAGGPTTIPGHGKKAFQSKEIDLPTSPPASIDVNVVVTVGCSSGGTASIVTQLTRRVPVPS